MTVAELKRHIIGELTPAVGAREAQAMMREIFLVLKGYTPADVVINGDRTVLDQTVDRVNGWIERVRDGEPFQYVIGRAPFMGMELTVTPAVLIPRPETAQLVDMITDYARGRSDLNVLDVGTGSGCIALALARALPFSRVTGVDISDAPLQVARHNAGEYKIANVDFIKADALNLSAYKLPTPFDIIVSNPPYIAESEKKEMDPRVYDHEPQGALFVPDSDPLVFYRAISLYARDNLTPAGILFFEINPLFVKELKSMLQSQDWSSVDILADYRGRQRFAFCRL